VTKQPCSIAGFFGCFFNLVLIFLSWRISFPILSANELIPETISRFGFRGLLFQFHGPCTALEAFVTKAQKPLLSTGNRYSRTEGRPLHLLSAAGLEIVFCL
jgi:hypothetical protein